MKHTITYSHVYNNGWENGRYKAELAVDTPSEAAHVLLEQCRSAQIVGVRVRTFDGEYVDLLHVPEDQLDVICIQHKRPPSFHYHHTHCFRFKYGAPITRAVLAGTVCTSPNIAYRPLSAYSVTGNAVCVLCKQPIRGNHDLTGKVDA